MPPGVARRIFWHTCFCLPALRRFFTLPLFGVDRACGKSDDVSPGAILQWPGRIADDRHAIHNVFDDHGTRPDESFRSNARAFTDNGPCPDVSFFADAHPARQDVSGARPEVAKLLGRVWLRHRSAVR